MTSKTTNKFSPEVRTRAVRMVLDHQGDHASRWAAIASIAAKIGCTGETLGLWVKNAQPAGDRRRAGVRGAAHEGRIAERNRSAVVTMSDLITRLKAEAGA